MHELYWRAFEYLETKCDFSGEGEEQRLWQFSCECLSEFPELLPEAVRVAIDTAKAFRAGSIGESELTEARISLWKSIAGREVEFDDPGVCIVRATVGLMFPPEACLSPCEELDSFLDHCAMAKLDEMKVFRVLRRVYAVYLGDFEKETQTANKPGLPRATW